jgi:hypothetical protein
MTDRSDARLVHRLSVFASVPICSRSKDASWSLAGTDKNALPGNELGKYRNSILYGGLMKLHHASDEVLLLVNRWQHRGENAAVA